MAYISFFLSAMFLLFTIIIIIPRIGNNILARIPYADIINSRKLKIPLILISIGLFAITKEDATISYYGFPDKETMKAANKINIESFKDYEKYLNTKKEEEEKKKKYEKEVAESQRWYEERLKKERLEKEKKFVPGDENNIIILPGKDPMTLKECRDKGICPMAR